MALQRQFKCDQCEHTIEPWDDGNPYYIDEKGHKQYAYHPNHEALARCVGNDVPHLCLACANDFTQDSEAPVGACPRCGSAAIVDQCNLAECVCPFCRKGKFVAMDGWLSIS